MSSVLSSRVRFSMAEEGTEDRQRQSRVGSPRRNYALACSAGGYFGTRRMSAATKGACEAEWVKSCSGSCWIVMAGTLGRGDGRILDRLGGRLRLSLPVIALLKRHTRT
jgi:hypothetical protein